MKIFKNRGLYFLIIFFSVCVFVIIWFQTLCRLSLKLTMITARLCFFYLLDLVPFAQVKKMKKNSKRRIVFYGAFFYFAELSTQRSDCCSHKLICCFNSIVVLPIYGYLSNFEKTWWFPRSPNISQSNTATIYRLLFVFIIK